MTVFNDFSHQFYPGKAAILSGPSGSGKSTLLRMIYGTYKTESGHIRVCHQGRYVDVAGASPALIYALRRETIGYVSQFLRVVPRVSALDTVIEPLLARGVPPKQATDAGRILLERLHIPSTMWHLSATTFPAENSNVSTWPGASSPHIPFCCWMNPPRPLT